MKIIINGRFLTQRITGVQRYAREIVAELDRLLGRNEVELVVPADADDLPQYKNIKVKKIGVLHKQLWEQISLPLYVWRKKGISLNLCNSAPLIYPGIVCICDIKIKTVPQFFSRSFLLWYKLLFWNIAKRAKKIITISEFSKREICKYYDIDKEKITVIPCAWQHYESVEFDDDTLDRYGLERRNYFFSLSSLEPNKNFKWIAETAQNNEHQTFVIAGAINKTVFSKELGFTPPDNMIFLGYVSDEEAKTLMRDCKAFLFPTFYEGFGIPPMEALSAGAKAIIVSDTEVMHEIYGDTAIYINPYESCFNINEIVGRANNAITINLLKRYSWKQSAGEMLNIIQKQIRDPLL